MRLLSIPRAGWLHSFGGITLWTRALAAVLTRRKGRKTLADLDDRMLQDIGLTRAVAMAEAEKPFWRD